MTDTDTDLFGNPVAAPVSPPSTPRRPVTNNMDLIEHVLTTACQDGYALLGTDQRVYRVGAADPRGAIAITAVPDAEANAVHQLIDTRDLVVGGQHRYRQRHHREQFGRAVLVPRATRAKTARWAALHRTAAWSARTHHG